MKLSPEQYKGLGKISRYFEEIESIAEHMSASEDILEEAFRTNKMEVHNRLKPNQFEIAASRQQVFRRFHQENPQSSIVNLNVIINENRF
jgi:hypothetical protein